MRADEIDQLLKARTEIDEELRRHKAKVTVLFTDIVGSTSYFDRYGDTAGMLLLHRHDHLVTGAVSEFHGTVIKTIGDSVMAEFSEPQLAVLAAIEIQRRLFEQNQSRAADEHLQVRAGINAGMGFRRGNDLFGDAVNVAARLTKLSGPAQILVSRSVWEATLDSDIWYKPIPPTNLEGKAETEEIYEVIWTDTAAYEELRTNLAAVSFRSRTPLDVSANSQESLPNSKAPRRSRRRLFDAIGLVVVIGALIAAAIAYSWKTQSNAELAAFRLAQSSDTPEAWNRFLENYRDSELVSAAHDRLVQLRSQVLEKAKTPPSEPKDVVPAPAVTPPVTLSPISPASGQARPVPMPTNDIKAIEKDPKENWMALIDSKLIPGGVFMMGTDNSRKDEKPAHQVKLDAFRMSSTEVTNRQYLAFLKDTGHPRPKDPAFAKNYLIDYPDLPVVNVSYQDAIDFCAWVNKKFGVTSRLPTEAEWEYAALGGKKNTVLGALEAKDVSRYNGNSTGPVKTVGQAAFPANGFGLYNMSGNVWEWVSDFYSKDYYQTSPLTNPRGPESGTKRVIRGGSWADDPTELSSFRRANRDPNERSDQIGFRIVVESRTRPRTDRK